MNAARLLPVPQPGQGQQRQSHDGAAGNSMWRSSASNDTEAQIKANDARKGFTRPAWWVLAFGWSLAACAGIVNAVAFRSFGGYVSHGTGGTTSVALGVEGAAHSKNGWEKPMGAVKILSSFVLGAFACGLLIDKNHVRLGGKALYGAALVGNAVLLVLATVAYEETHEATLSSCLAAAACGLQNAMCTSHFGAIVRTTHVTGTLTDIGSTTGRMAMIFLRKGSRCFRLNVLERAEISVDARKLLVLLPMWCSFLAGAGIGAFLQDRLGVYALLLPATLTFTSGITYSLFRELLKHHFNRMLRSNLQQDIDEIKKDIDQINETLSRAQSFAVGSQVMRSQRSAERDDAVADLKQEVGQMLQAMQRVGAGIEDLCAGDDVRAEQELAAKAKTEDLEAAS